MHRGTYTHHTHSMCNVRVEGRGQRGPGNKDGSDSELRQAGAGKQDFACRSGTFKHANVTDAKLQQSGSVVQPVALIRSSVARSWFSRHSKGRWMPEGELHTGPRPSLCLSFCPTHAASRHFPAQICSVSVSERTPLGLPTHVLAVKRSVTTYIRL